jgi:hypothetical protein
MLLDQGGEDRDPAAAVRAWLDRGDPGGRGVGAVLGCCERGQRAGLACLLRRAGREDTAAVQGFVAGRPELAGIRLAADFG